MGKRTGARKISAMKNIEGLEEEKRGLQQGAGGYYTGGGDFEQNEGIGSIRINEIKKDIINIIGD